MAGERICRTVRCNKKLVGGLHRAGCRSSLFRRRCAWTHTTSRTRTYVKAGLSALEAIQAATITPARVMKLENEVGTMMGVEADERSHASRLMRDRSNAERLAFYVNSIAKSNCSFSNADARRGVSTTLTTILARVTVHGWVLFLNPICFRVGVGCSVIF